MNDETCSICLESSAVGDNLDLPCNHAFHEICINKWIKKHRKTYKCPLCLTEYSTGSDIDEVIVAPLINFDHYDNNVLPSINFRRDQTVNNIIKLNIITSCLFTVLIALLGIHLYLQNN